MSAQAKLFITLCKQTVSRTACRSGGGGGMGGGGEGRGVSSVRAASTAAAAWPPPPSLFLLSLLLGLLLITPQTQASGPSDQAQGCACRWDNKGAEAEVRCLYFRVLRLDFFCLFHLCSIDHTRWRGSLWNRQTNEYAQCLYVYEMHVEKRAGRGGWMAASELWEAGWSPSLTRSRAQPTWSFNQ